MRKTFFLNMFALITFCSVFQTFGVNVAEAGLFRKFRRGVRRGVRKVRRFRRRVRRIRRKVRPYHRFLRRHSPKYRNFYRKYRSRFNRYTGRFRGYVRGYNFGRTVYRSLPRRVFRPRFIRNSFRGYRWNIRPRRFIKRLPGKIWISAKRNFRHVKRRPYCSYQYLNPNFYKVKMVLQTLRKYGYLRSYSECMNIRRIANHLTRDKPYLRPLIYIYGKCACSRVFR